MELRHLDKTPWITWHHYPQHTFLLVKLFFKKKKGICFLELFLWHFRKHNVHFELTFKWKQRDPRGTLSFHPKTVLTAVTRKDSTGALLPLMPQLSQNNFFKHNCLLQIWQVLKVKSFLVLPYQRRQRRTAYPGQLWELRLYSNLVFVTAIKEYLTTEVWWWVSLQVSD